MDWLIMRQAPTSWSSAWDDGETDDDSSVPQSNAEPVWKWSNEQDSIDVSLLLIGIGTYGPYFLNQFFTKKNKEHIGCISIQHRLETEEEILYGGGSLSKDDRTCKIYLFKEENETVAVVECEYAVPPSLCAEWTEVLFKYINPKRVAVFDSISAASYKPPQPDKFIELPYLRKLSTSIERDQSKDSVCPFLEPPNIIDKLSAAVLSHCQVNYIPAAVYISLDEGYLPSGETFVAFEQVFQDRSISCLTSPFTAEVGSVSYVSVVSSLTTSAEGSHNPLYM